MEEFLNTLVIFSIIFFKLVGVLIIAAGSLYACIVFLLSKIPGNKHRVGYNQFRFLVARSIIAGLELIVAADVINTVADQDYYRLGILLILIVIRTLMNFFLIQELKTSKS